MNNLRAVSKLAPRLTCRNFSTGKQQLTVSMRQSYGEGTSKGIVPSNEGYARVRQLQNEMNKHPDLMSWQKRGARDNGPTYVTAGLCAASTLYCFALIWKMSFPPQN